MTNRDMINRDMINRDMKSHSRYLEGYCGFLVNISRLALGRRCYFCENEANNSLRK